MEEAQSHPPSGGDRSAETAEALRTLRDQADQALETHRQRVGGIESELSRCVEHIAQALARDHADDDIEAEASAEQRVALEQLQERCANIDSEAHQLRAQLVSQSSEYEAQLAQREHELDELREQFDRERSHLQNQLDERQGELAQLRDDYKQLHQATDAQLAEREEQLRQQRAESEQQLGEQSGQLEEVRQALEELRNEACDDCAATRAELADSNGKLQDLQQQLETTDANNANATALLQDAEQRIVELSKCAEYEEQLQQTQRKFELALADVHKLKKENTELHEELVRRPEADEQESPELVSLRAERDALAARLVELEGAAEQPFDADAEQQMADLQRRFEMAVDDVRQLKQENADLQSRLQANSDSGGDAGDDTGQDWQAQKARLLAALDAEEGAEISPERTAERTTIEGAISITDRVVAEKDAELVEIENQLAELRAQLEAKPAEQDLEEMKRTIHAELFDQDELVQAERGRLKQLQEEMQGKLREAELEISVQRATLAREQAELNEKLAEFRTADPDPSTPDDGKPRRRWLSALGIRDDEDE